MLNNEIIDNIIAQNIMGYIPSELNWWMIPDGFNCSVEKAWLWVYESNDGTGVEYNGKKYYSKNKCNWNPTKDISICYEVENRINDLGLKEQYIQALISIVGLDIYNLIHATPLQRCKAIVNMIKTK